MTNEDLHHFHELLDRAWEEELALYFRELAHDLESGRITVEEATERFKNICSSSR